MPDLRRDPIVGRWVIISTERNGRPHDFAQMQPAKPISTAICPFCPGQERLTPKEIMAYRPQPGEPNSPNWTVRVIPNKFPALQVEGDMGREGIGLYDRMNGVGAHEVIIESPGHKEGLADLPTKKIEDVLWAYRDRMIDLRKDLRFRYILIFKNHGASAGATLEHSHSQLIALPIVPTSVTGRTRRLPGPLRAEGTLHLLRHPPAGPLATATGSWRKIRNSSVSRPMPRASRLKCGFSPSAMPPISKKARNRSSNFWRRFSPSPCAAWTKRSAVPRYNFMLHSSPLHEKTGDFYHWHLEIIPKLTQVAGFEWGTGFYINPVVTGRIGEIPERSGAVSSRKGAARSSPPRCSLPAALP